MPHYSMVVWADGTYSVCCHSKRRYPLLNQDSNDLNEIVQSNFDIEMIKEMQSNNLEHINCMKCNENLGLKVHEFSDNLFTREELEKLVQTPKIKYLHFSLQISRWLFLFHLHSNLYKSLLFSICFL